MDTNQIKAGVFTLVILAILGNGQAHADIPLSLYHLGEADPGAVAPNTGDDPTIDSGTLGNNLPREGNPTYSSNVAAPGSSLSMAFDGASDYLFPSAIIANRTSFVAISAWIYPTANNIVATIAYNGNSSTSGFGLYQFFGSGSNATIIGLLGGVTLGPSVNIPLNQWTEVTQVVAAGQDQLYVNGVLSASLASTPNPAVGIFGIGGHGAEYFQGNIDEVRIYLTPEPSSLALLGLGALGLFRVARRRRRA